MHMRLTGFRLPVRMVAINQQLERYMNIKKSFRIALAKHDATQAEMAAVIGVTPATLSLLINRDAIPTTRLQEIADAFGMKVSEFVALGED